MPPHIGQGTSAAMEDAVILTRLLEANDDLFLAFKKFENIRRPRIKQLFEYAATSGDMRREKSPWALWAQEKTLSWVLYLTPECWMAKPFAYDVFTVPVDVNQEE
jgi:2-polyprenyl-6-methoxyphenol hydroxylase-like FAD-dependent oxidoreductase